MQPSTKNDTLLLAAEYSDREHALAADGRRLIDVIRDWGVEAAAECGGAGLCGNGFVEHDETFVSVPTNDAFKWPRLALAVGRA